MKDDKNKKIGLSRILLYALLLFPVVVCIWGIVQGESLAAALQGDIQNGQISMSAGNEFEQEYRIDEDAGHRPDFLQFLGISLKPGIYRIEIDYRCSSDWTNSVHVSMEGGSHHALWENAIGFFGNLKHMDYLVWLWETTESFTVHVDYSGIGEFAIKDIRIYKTNQGSICALILLLIIYLVAGSWLWWKRRHERKGELKEGKHVLIALCIIIITSSFPLLVDYCIGGGDMGFHLLRIEGLMEGLKSGQFPVRLQPNWLKGHGYAVSVFYCDTFLLFPALLRLIGFPVIYAYHFFIIIVNAATAVTSYVCSKKFFSSKYIGILGSVLYTLAPYRIYNIYTRNAVGEYTAMIFLPCIFLGFAMIFRRKTDDCIQKCERGWLWLVIGFTGVIQSHVISCELVAGFSVLLCVVLYKRLLKKEILLDILKAALATFFLNLWYLVPFIDYFVNGDYVFHHTSARTIQERGLYIAHLFYTWNWAGENEHFDITGMTDTVPTTIGAALLVCVLLFVYWILNTKATERVRWEYGVAKTTLFLGSVAMLCSLNIFPWDAIQRKSHLFSSLVSNIQFPMRFLLVATICLSFFGCAIGKLVMDWKDKRLGRIIVGGVMMIGLMSSIFYVNDMIYGKNNVLRLYAAENMGNGAILGAEYLPYGTDLSLISYENIGASEGIQITQHSKNYLDMEINCENSAAEEGYIDYPMLYYKGYAAKDYTSGAPLFVEAGANGTVRVIVPPKFQGKIGVWFQSPWYWRLSELLSFITLSWLVFRFCGISTSKFCSCKKQIPRFKERLTHKIKQ